MKRVTCYSMREGRGELGSVCALLLGGLIIWGKRGIQEATMRKQCDIKAFKREI